MTNWSQQGVPTDKNFQRERRGASGTEARVDSETVSINGEEHRTTEMGQSFYIPGKEVKIESYPEESTFVYKSHRKNLMLVRPKNRDAFRAVSV